MEQKKKTKKTLYELLIISDFNAEQDTVLCQSDLYEGYFSSSRNQTSEHLVLF